MHKWLNCIFQTYTKDGSVLEIVDALVIALRTFDPLKGLIMVLVSLHKVYCFGCFSLELYAGMNTPLGASASEAEPMPVVAIV